MIDIKKAKVKLLSFAFQGALVDFPNKEKSNEALNDIHSKQKGFAPVETEEYLIAAPSYWSWSRLGYITKNHGQIVPDTDFCYIDVGTLDNVHQRFAEKENLVNAKDAPSRARKIVQFGDVLYSTVRPYLHNICVIDKNFSRTPIASTAFCVMQANESVLLNKYLFYWLLTPEFDKYSNGDPSKGALYPAIGEKDLLRGVIPLPSVDEQRLIVEKIEQAFSILDTIDELQAQYAENLTVLKSKLIDLAIRGKLTEQLPEDGTAEELYQQIQDEKQALIKSGKIKKEKPFSESPVFKPYPFEIPNSWRFVRFGKLMINRDSERIPVSVADRRQRKKIYDYYGASGVIDGIDDYLFDKDLLLIGEDGANLLARSSPVAFIASGQYWVNNHAHVLDVCSGTDLKYVCVYINAISLEKYVTGSAQPKMNQENMNAIWVALPPLAEQKRIVDRLDKLLAVCDEMK